MVAYWGRDTAICQYDILISRPRPVSGVESPVVCFPEEKCSQSATPASSKPASPVTVVFEYNNRSGTPTRLGDDPPKRRKTSRSKSPSESRKKRRKKSPTPPSAYANPHRQVSVHHCCNRQSKLCMIFFFLCVCVCVLLEIIQKCIALINVIAENMV